MCTHYQHTQTHHHHIFPYQSVEYTCIILAYPTKNYQVLGACMYVAHSLKAIYYHKTISWVLFFWGGGGGEGCLNIVYLYENYMVTTLTF